MSRRRNADLRLWIAGFAAWTLVALLSILQRVIGVRAAGLPVGWADVVPARFADWYTCAIFTPAYFWLVRRFPVSRGDWARPAAIYAAATMVFVVLKFVMYAPVLAALQPASDPAVTLGRLLTRGFIAENVAFWCVLAMVMAIEYYRRLGERDLQTAQLAAQLADARLDVLAGQLHPHFLFNTLQGVSTLIHRDPGAAERMLTHLSELLRRTLHRGGGHEVTLSEELELLELYLSILRTRFSDRLAVAVQVPPGLGAALVPRFVLQPLVENAVQHGIGRRAGSGRIEISAERSEGQLVLRVSDDGPGAGDGAAPAFVEGIGLSNTRRRLAQLYGDAAALELSNGGLGGLSAALRIPWRMRSAAAAAPEPVP